MAFDLQELGRALAGFPAPGAAAEGGARADGEGADFVLNTVTDTMHLMREELSLLRCGACAVKWHHCCGDPIDRDIPQL